jgi:integrase
MAMGQLAGRGGEDEMARPIHRLSVAAVKNIKQPGLHADGAGLYLQVSIGADGFVRRSWIFRYQRGTRVRDMGLGPTHTHGLAEARELARACRQQLARNVDPIEHRRAERAGTAAKAVAVMTFDQCAEIYAREHRKGWSPVHARQWSSSLAAYASPFIGRLSVADIGIEHVRKVLDPIWTTKPETASRVRGRVESVIAWAIVSGYRTGDNNPARWKNHLDKLLPPTGKVREVVRQPALPHAEMPAFMADLRTRKGMGALLLEFTILTAVRSTDARHARRQDVDRVARLWTIPKFSKTRSEHRVPLSDAALAVLDAAAKIASEVGGAVARSEFCFPNDVTGAALSENVMLETLRRMGVKGKMTAHGARSALRTWAQEMTNFSWEVAEMALGHKVGSKVERAYLRGSALEKRAALMQSWANYLAKPRAPAEVIPIGRGA